MLRRFPQCVLSILISAHFLAIGWSGEPLVFSSQEIEFFETRIRPLLVEHCFECHSKNAKQIQGGLRLDHRQQAVLGGDTGPAIVAGNPEKSLLINAVRWKDYEMPPNGKLRDAEIEALESWIQNGAAWPENKTELMVQKPGEYDFEKVGSADYTGSLLQI